MKKSDDKCFKQNFGSGSAPDCEDKFSERRWKISGCVVWMVTAAIFKKISRKICWQIHFQLLILSIFAVAVFPPFFQRRRQDLGSEGGGEHFMGLA